MNTETNVQIVNDVFAVMCRSDRQASVAMTTEEMWWIIPAEDWPLAGVHQGHAELKVTGI